MRAYEPCGVVKLVTGSTGEPVSRLEAKIWLKVEEEDVTEDSLIDGLIAKARQRIEELRNRSFMLQTFDYYLDGALTGGDPVKIPKAPLVSVTSIKAFALTDLTDSGGTAMSTSGYYVDTAREFGRVVPVSPFTYPVATRQVNGTIIRFTAGYSSGSSGVPDTAKTEIKQLVALLYEHRGDEAESEKVLAEYGCVPNELDLPTWG